MSTPDRAAQAQEQQERAQKLDELARLSTSLAAIDALRAGAASLRAPSPVAQELEALKAEVLLIHAREVDGLKSPAYLDALHHVLITINMRLLALSTSPVAPEISEEDREEALQMEWNAGVAAAWRCVREKAARGEDVVQWAHDVEKLSPIDIQQTARDARALLRLDLPSGQEQ